MKNIIMYFVIGIIIFSLSFFMFYHPVVENQYDFLPPLCIENDNDCEIIETKELAYKIARDIFVEKYGYSSLIFMSFDCRLQDNKYWIFEGRNKFHILFKTCGGGPYIVIEKTGKILALGYTG